MIKNSLLWKHSCTLKKNFFNTQVIIPPTNTNAQIWIKDHMFSFFQKFEQLTLKKCFSYQLSLIDKTITKNDKTMLKRIQKVRGHMLSGQEPKKQREKTRFLVFFFPLLREREAKFVQDVKWGWEWKKYKKSVKKHNFFYYPNIKKYRFRDTKKNMHDKLKQTAFFRILPYIIQYKKFFVLYFLDRKILNFQFPPHYKTFYFSFFFPCSSHG